MYNHLNTAETATAKSGQIASNTSSDFHNFIAEVEDLVKQATTLTGEELSRAKTKLSARLTEAKDSVMTMRDETAKHARSTFTATNHYVHDQPWKAIGASTFVGLLVGVLLARR